MMTKTNTSKGPRGYSTVVVRKIQQADSTQPAIELALLCIDLDIPMAHVAETLGVSRMTVHNWFTNKFIPKAAKREQIVAIIDALKKQ